MRVGVTGHQEREGMDWPWVRESLRELLTTNKATEALSSLAQGTDQIFAEEALALTIPLTAVIPLRAYDAFFDEEALVKYRTLLGQARRIDLDLSVAPERAFFEAGKFIVDKCDLLVAVWDGRPAEGLGGTADVVSYALDCGRQIVWLDPLEAEIHTDGSFP